jgi:hypothetical protein
MILILEEEALAVEVPEEIFNPCFCQSGKLTGREKVYACLKIKLKNLPVFGEVFNFLNQSACQSIIVIFFTVFEFSPFNWRK